MSGDQFTFELTFDDYQSAMLAHDVGSGATDKHGGTPIWQWLIIAVAVCAALGIVASTVKNPTVDVIAPLKDAIRQHYLLVAPWFVLVAVSVSYNLAARLSRAQIAVGLGFLLMVNVASAIGALMDVGVIGTIPWILVLHFWFRSWTQLITQSGLRSQWHRLTHLHGNKTFRWDDEGFVIEEPTVTLVYRWNAILGWRETSSVLMLYVSTSSFHLLPVRAFPSAGSVKDLRQTIVESLKNRADGRFPVINPAKAG